jgi:tetratricopeptide (TPR) repeat protein
MSSGPFGVREIRSLYPAVTDNHLRYLEKWGLVRASQAPRDSREYSFADLTTIKHVAGELERGTPLRVVLRDLVAERQGQLVLDFSGAHHDLHAAADTPRAKVVTLQGHRSRTPPIASATPLPAGGVKDLGFPFSDPQAALAARYFIEASRLDDGDERRMEEAAAAYRKALVVDPDLVPGIVNLANIHYARDEMIEAQALYERAIRLEPHCFEAHFNLGNIHHDLGRFESALACYREAVALNPAYPDAHFYLAVTLEKTGASAAARPHWKAYQDLAPQGEWVELAKEFSD